MYITFVETKEKAVVTFSGWDGKSYNGEPRQMKVYTHEMHPDKKFVRTWLPKYKEYVFHQITDVLHPVSGVNKVCFFCSVER